MAIINKGQLVIHGNPVHIMDQLEGQLYEKAIHKKELEYYRKEYHVINDRLFLGKPIIHVISDSHPGNGFQSINASLEDVYMFQILNA